MRVQRLGYNTARSRGIYNMGKQVVDTFGRCSGYACSGENRRGKRFAGTDKTLRVNGFIISSSPQMGPVLADKQRIIRIFL